MRGRVETWARKWWAGELGAAGAALSALATPAGWSWAAACALRNARYAALPGRRVEGVVVLSIGNLAVGGTGKTPFAAWVARRVRARGVPTAIAAGGQGADEAHLHRVWNPDVPVMVDRDRVAGAVRAAEEGARVVVLDDGFQHRRIARHLDLVLLSAEDAFPGPLLPRGPYREPVGALGRAHGVVVTRRIAPEASGRALAEAVERAAPVTVDGGVHLAPGPWTGLDGRPCDPPAGDVLAVCGVARAGVFRRVVESGLTGGVELVAFADHHDYRRSGAARLRDRARGRAIVTTEKDAIKLRPYREPLGRTYVLTEELRWDWGGDVIGALIDRVAEEVVDA